MLAPVFRCMQDCDKDKGGRAPFDPFNLQGPTLSTVPGLRTTQAQALYRLFYWLGIYTSEVGPFTFPFITPVESLWTCEALHLLSLIPQLAQDYRDTVSIVLPALLSHKKAPCITIVATHKHR